jgi:hypothetical protein
MVNHGDVGGWFEVFGTGRNRWKEGDFGSKQKPRRLRERAGFERNPVNDSVLELPACLHGIEAHAKSVRLTGDRLGIEPVRAIHHAHDQLPLHWQRMFG